MSTTDWIFLTIIIIAICITVHCVLENYFYYKIKQIEQNKNQKKMKKTKLYVIVPHKNGKITLFNANKIEELEPYLPSMEVIKTNIDLQVAKWEKDNSYKPQPLMLHIPLDIFLKVKAITKGKWNEIPLNQGCNGVPSVLLIPNKKEDGE